MVSLKSIVGLIFFSIAGRVGVPTATDEATPKKTFGYFARVIIDIELHADIHDGILLETDDFAFFVSLKSENLPAFYFSCQSIGQDISSCKHVINWILSLVLDSKKKVQGNCVKKPEMIYKVKNQVVTDDCVQEASDPKDKAISDSGVPNKKVDDPTHSLEFFGMYSKNTI